MYINWFKVIINLYNKVMWLLPRVTIHHNMLHCIIPRIKIVGRQLAYDYII